MKIEVTESEIKQMSMEQLKEKLADLHRIHEWGNRTRRYADADLAFFHSMRIRKEIAKRKENEK